MQQICNFFKKCFTYKQEKCTKSRRGEPELSNFAEACCFPGFEFQSG